MSHDDYIAKGGCPSVMPLNEKCWCNDKAGHPGAHWAPRVQPGYKVATVTWSPRR